MASDVSICNLALSHIGTATINSLDDPTKEGRACKLHFAAVRDSVLREHPWNFATKREYLSLLNTTPVGWSFAYAYPSDCLFARELWQQTRLENPTPFETVRGTGGRVIVTNEQDAVLEYTSAVTDATQFDPLFVDALSYKLAAELAMPITRSVPISQAMLNLYLNRLQQAATMDSREGREDPEHPYTFLRARL